ncbi:unnamed protein product [Periconia digitata]|uniref:Uncharacterized protein n=1 Tax=Periconia digitata TaxID=1303443 RepID=A0A9W4XR66_9PLEO|nr:unnamed protein product [Periconia digitata]
MPDVEVHMLFVLIAAVSIEIQVMNFSSPNLISGSHKKQYLIEIRRFVEHTSHVPNIFPTFERLTSSCGCSSLQNGDSMNSVHGLLGRTCQYLISSDFVCRVLRDLSDRDSRNHLQIHRYLPDTA